MIQEIFGDQDIDPLPLGFRSGDLIHGSHITGANPKTAELPQSIEAQLDNAYENLRICVEGGGGTRANVAHVSMYFADFQRDRGAMNPPWLRMFPDENDRPTYKFMPARLPGGQLVHMEFYAVLGQPRQVLSVPGVAHTNPIPLGVRMGRYLFSSRVLPYDPGTGQAADGAEAQARFVFQNATALLEAGEMGWADVRQGRAFLADPTLRPLVDAPWEARFPDPATRPRLQRVRYGGGALQVMLEVFACQTDGDGGR